LTTEDFDRDSRKNKNIFSNRKKKKYSEISDEQKLVYKSKKELRHRIENLRENEIWEDWEEKNR